MFRYWSRHPRT